MIGPLFTLLVPLVAAVGGGDLAAAERAFDDGKFAVARELYEEALREPGVPAAAVLYDLGNCAYRQERYPEAILFWRRALLRRSRDGETVFNLRLAERALGIESATPGLAARTVALAGEHLDSRSLLALVALLQACGVLALMRARRGRGRVVAGALVLLAWAGAAAWWVDGEGAEGSTAVVLGEGVALRSAPRKDAPRLAPIAPGRLVRVEEAAGGWLRVEYGRDRGWMEAAEVGLVE